MTDLIQLEVQRPDKPSSVFPISAGVYTVGSEDDCRIRLSHAGVDKRHAILTVRDSDCWVEDLDAPQGTSVDNVKIHGRVAVSPGQHIGIGPFTLVIRQREVPGTNSRPAPPSPATKDTAPPKTPEPVADAPVPVEPMAREKPADNKAAHPAIGQRAELGADLEKRRSVKQQIHKELVERLDIKRLSASRIDRDELHARARKAIRDIVGEVSSKLPGGMKPSAVIKEVYDEALGLGPLEDYLADTTITEIMVNGPDQIYVEKNGRLVHTGSTFMDDDSVLAIIERIVSPIGRRIDESQPYVDARLPDGSRVNAIIHPLSLVGPCITIRKFSKTPFTNEDLIGFGTMTPHIAELVNICVMLRKNIIISGGTGSGKTTLLNVFSSFLPETDRIVTIEDAAELRMRQKHVVRLEARPPNIEGRGAVAIRDLVRNSLRMRPDRIVVGECRGGEALDMLQAMNTGHDGSLTTVHANSPRDVISRLETMVLMAGMDLPVRAIREQIASAIDVIVHESRFSDGTRKVVKVTEVCGLEGDQITMQDIFEYLQTGIDEEGNVLGHFRPTGAVPTFLPEIHSRGLTINQKMFDPIQSEES
jgi:pilus assembly protein CpaF